MVSACANDGLRFVTCASTSAGASAWVVRSGGTRRCLGGASKGLRGRSAPLRGLGGRSTALGPRGPPCVSVRAPRAIGGRRRRCQDDARVELDHAAVRACARAAPPLPRGSSRSESRRTGRQSRTQPRL
eukprot:scaffold30281_cov63-Phaeocystis_antarctica.AAC.2